MNEVVFVEGYSCGCGWVFRDSFIVIGFFIDFVLSVIEIFLVLV